MGTILKIESLKYKNILKNVSFELEENTFNILIGPNGCGKTILLECIAGEKKDDGFIYYKNNIISEENYDEYRKNIGVLTNKNALFNGTVIYNLLLPLLNLNYTEVRSKKKVYALAKKFNISNILFKNVKELSLTEEILVNFLSSIITDPKVLLIDACFDNLDIENRNKILDYLKNKNTTILYVTNNEEEIVLSDNIILMKDGKIISTIKRENILEEEKQLIKCNFKLPFVYDLSSKLKSYDLIKNDILNIDDLVVGIWK